MTELRYRPDVDGLRAVAVVLVLLFHANLGWAGGFVGVDVFFVISGFLITGVIRKQQHAGTFTMRNFWVRRIRRIIPASILMVGGTLIIGSVVLFRSDFRELVYSAVAQLVMLANVFFWQQTGYFAGSAELKPLMHMWSLAVEEQFYLGYPFLLVLLNRTSNKTAGRVLASIAILSFALSVWGVHHYPRATFFLLPARAWEMLLGGLIWFVPPPEKLTQWKSETLSWFALAGILVASWFYDGDTLFPGIAALLPCLATAAIIYLNANQQTRVSALLSTRPFVFVGLISYSLYLWHWPLLAFCRYSQTEPLSVGYRVSILLVSGVLAYMSWRFVETPWRQGARLRSKRSLLVVATGALAAIVLANVAVGSVDVWTFYYPELEETNALADGDDEQHFDVLLLGGSVLEQVARKLEPETLAPLAPAGMPIRIYNLTVAAHTSRDSLLKMRLLKHREFDLVIVYQGINDARMNCCETDRFRDDYTHCEWYESMVERVARNKITLTDIVADTTSRLIPIGEPTPERAALGRVIKTEPAFKANLTELINIATRSAKTRVAVGSFALFLPETYTQARFENGELGYVKGQYGFPVESWGEPEAVRTAVAAHNRIIRSAADSNPRVTLLNLETLLIKDVASFSDPCHLSDSGLDMFINHMISELAPTRANENQ